MGKFKGAKGHLLVAAIEFSRLVIQDSFGFVLGTRKRDVKLQKMDISVMFVDLFLKTDFFIYSVSLVFGLYYQLGIQFYLWIKMQIYYFNNFL